MTTSSPSSEREPVELRLPDAADALAEDLLVDRGWLQDVIDLLRTSRS